MSDNTILYLAQRPKDALAKVALSENFCAQTERPLGTEGLLRRYDPEQKDVAVIDIGERFPVRVHCMDFTIIG